MKIYIAGKTTGKNTFLTKIRLGDKIKVPCGCCITAITRASQARDGGSTPLNRFKHPYVLLTVTGILKMPGY